MKKIPWNLKSHNFACTLAFHSSFPFKLIIAQNMIHKTRVSDLCTWEIIIHGNFFFFSGYTHSHDLSLALMMLYGDGDSRTLEWSELQEYFFIRHGKKCFLEINTQSLTSFIFRSIQLPVFSFYLHPIPQLIFQPQLLNFILKSYKKKRMKRLKTTPKNQTFKINRITISNLSSFCSPKVMPFLFGMRFIALTFKMVLLCDVQDLHSITLRCKWSSLTKRPNKTRFLKHAC